MRTGERITNVGMLFRESLRKLFSGLERTTVSDVAFVPEGMECGPLSDNTMRVEVFRLIAPRMNVFAIVIELDSHRSNPVPDMFVKRELKAAYVVIREQKGRSAAWWRQSLRRLQPVFQALGEHRRRLLRC